MARSTIVQLTDDLDGGDAEESVNFSFRGTEYEIDLSTKNANALEKALTKYLDVARRLSKNKGAGRAPVRSDTRKDTADIRAWACENGYEVSDRGRISAEIREAYDAAD